MGPKIASDDHQQPERGQPDPSEKVKGAAGSTGNDIAQPTIHKQLCNPNKPNFLQWVNTFLLAGALLAAAFAAFFTWQQSKTALDQVELARKTAINQQRAWIAPGGINFEKVPYDAKYWIVGLKYKNTGNQPALKLSQNIAAFPIPSGKIHNIVVLNGAILRAMGGKKCKEFSGKGAGSAVFPQAKHTLVVDITPAKVKQYRNNTHFLVVAGYFAYETFGEIHRSCFCRFFDFTADRKKPKNWRSSVCDIPEYAD